jgi:hypothetical protein
MTSYYAGIGSRKTPDDVLEYMTSVATKLNSAGYTLRSGGAQGADTAFAIGAETNFEIFRPEDATKEAIKIASHIHPAWHNCKSYVRKLHGRNVMIILGWYLDSPVEFVLCWTPGGKIIGGTALGIRLAKSKGIDVYNLFNPEDIIKFEDKYLLT